MMMENYSIVLTVYYKEKPQFFRESILSLVNQTRPTNDLVIVCDGPLTPELDSVIEEFTQKYDFINVVRYPENHGSGYAAQQGLLAAKNDIVGRMDSDDISCPDRFEKEVAKIEEGFDFIGGAIAEFEEDPNNCFSVKKTPENIEEIIKYSKKRNPFCNVTTCYRKSKVLAVGGYIDQLYLEDYTLGIKMIQSGAKCCNLQEVMVNVRSNMDQMARRSDKKLRKWFKKLRKYMLKTKYINWFQYVWYSFQTDVFCLSPNWLKRWFYKHLLRKRK